MNDQISILEHYCVSAFVPAARRRQAVASLDQCHVGGAAATTAFAEKFVIPPGARVLGVGCGPGGP